MEPLRLILLAASLLAAVALAWLPWRGHLDTALARFGAGARLFGILAIILLLLDPGIRATLGPVRPIVLLDNSVSMHATGAARDSVRGIAELAGEVILFGELEAGIPGGESRLGDALAAAVTAGRPIEIVTDGEISDANVIPPDLLAQASVTLAPRPLGPDVAITEVEMPTRIAAGDTLEIVVELLVTGPHTGDTIGVALRDGDRVLLRGSTRAGVGEGRQLVRLRGVLPPALQGDRWLQVVHSSGPDREPTNDVRWRRLRVMASPGIVVLLTTPDWDGRFLLSTLESVTEAAVRGYVQLQPGAWYRARDLVPVALDEVRAAANAAELLAVRGDTAAWRTTGRARVLWPVGQPAGDWYARSDRVSPISRAFAGIDTDSLPALPAAGDAGRADWTGLVALQARRGTPVPVVVGRLGNGRTVVIGVEGLYQWAFRGGEAEQAWRAMIAEATSWLLSTPAAVRGLAEPVEAVVERGRPVRFRHTSGEAARPPSQVTLTRDTVRRVDTLRFDRDGVAQLALPVGRYDYRFDDGTSGEVMVEPYSRELVPGPVTLTASSAVVAPTPVRRSLRGMLGWFGLALLGFVTEWGIRRRLGLA